MLYSPYYGAIYNARNSLYVREVTISMNRMLHAHGYRVAILARYRIGSYMLNIGNSTCYSVGANFMHYLCEIRIFVITIIIRNLILRLFIVIRYLRTEGR